MLNGKDRAIVRYDGIMSSSIYEFTCASDNRFLIVLGVCYRRTCPCHVEAGNLYHAAMEFALLQT
jgi:hypothetical protein